MGFRQRVQTEPRLPVNKLLLILFGSERLFRVRALFLSDLSQKSLFEALEMDLECLCSQQKACKYRFIV